MVRNLQELPGMDTSQHKMVFDPMDENSREKLRLALRLLMTLTEGGSCSPEDASALRSIAGGLDESKAPLDDLARLVIHREREALRRKHYPYCSEKDAAATCRPK